MQREKRDVTTGTTITTTMITTGSSAAATTETCAYHIIRSLCASQRAGSFITPDRTRESSSLSSGTTVTSSPHTYARRKSGKLGTNAQRTARRQIEFSISSLSSLLVFSSLSPLNFSSLLRYILGCRILSVIARVIFHRERRFGRPLSDYPRYGKERKYEGHENFPRLPRIDLRSLSERRRRGG